MSIPQAREAHAAAAAAAALAAAGCHDLELCPNSLRMANALQGRPHVIDAVSVTPPITSAVLPLCDSALGKHFEDACNGKIC